ncbi:ArsC family reductase [Kordiimonas sp. SCSIO 12610]|uniref:ArsC family reductase n=1 Tax=Kordiimonas sp. SCSIO 12610 TaxID=2829597 RepID=UPI00210C9F6E|nr:ArsC family reductase [Kordiimonas sp. SCSIO 12610]UTW54490.1 ArsC family reductase [Kordiimonas sp. SCSIO 12610]
MSITIFGIKNCDTVKKARKWLEAEGIEHTFHDFRKDGLTEGMVSAFVDALGWEAVLNRRGTTWRKLPESETDGVDEAKAKTLLLAHDALIKRPVWKKGDDYRLGFAAKDMETITDWVKS